MQMLNRLCKWRNYFAAWQFGSFAKGEREYDAIADHREMSIMTRVELNVICRLLVETKIVTLEQFRDALEAESVHLMEVYTDSFPGVFATDDGLEVLDGASDFCKVKDNG